MPDKEEGQVTGNRPVVDSINMQIFDELFGVSAFFVYFCTLLIKTKKIRKKDK